MNSDDYLRLIYGKLETEVIRSLKGKRTESIFKSLLKAKSNSVFNTLIKSSIEARDIPFEDLQELIRKNWLEMVTNTDNQTRRYILTTSGIWTHEQSIGKINIDILLEIIQTTNFDFSSTSDPLNEIEAVILMALLGFRVFSRETAMELSNSQKCNSWLEAIKEIEKLAIECKIIHKSILKNKKFGLEPPVSYLMRRVNNLTKKTNNIYCSPGNQVYYLSINAINHSTLNTVLILWGKVLHNVMSNQKKSDVIKEVNSIAQKHMIYICESFEMFGPGWNSLIDSISFHID